MVMEVTSEGVEWYEIDGICVSGDHRIHSESGEWWFVREDPRASQKENVSVKRVYCLNTTTRQIPLYGNSGIQYHFRDWEELEEEDTEGHRLWREKVYQLLNKGECLPSCYDVPQDIPLVGAKVEIHTCTGWQPISRVCVGDCLLLSDGRTQKVLGVVRGQASMITQQDSKQESKQWIQGGYVWDTVTDRWIPAPVEGAPSSEQTMGWNVITETGEWTARTVKGISRRRDFTEVGHQAIKGLYEMVSSRLRSSDSPFLTGPNNL
jgi:hypothetical protein